MELYFYNTHSRYQCGFYQGYDSQNCLITVIEKSRESADNSGAHGTLLTDLSIASEFLPHELSIACI